MGLLRKIARTGTRAAGRALSAHVVPDSLIPSWKTQKRLSDGYSLLTKTAKLVAGKKKKKGSSSTAYQSKALASVRRPSPKPPKKKFDKNGWGMGRSLPGGSDGVTFSRASPPPRPAGLRRKLVDAARNPRLVAQMGLDLLKADYQQKKDTFLSNLKHAVKVRKILR